MDMTPRGYLSMERFQGRNGFLGKIRFDSLWAWVGLYDPCLLTHPCRAGALRGA